MYKNIAFIGMHPLDSSHRIKVKKSNQVGFLTNDSNKEDQ